MTSPSCFEKAVQEHQKCTYSEKIKGHFCLVLITFLNEFMFFIGSDIKRLDIKITCTYNLHLKQC